MGSDILAGYHNANLSFPQAWEPSDCREEIKRNQSLSTTILFLSLQIHTDTQAQWSRGFQMLTANLQRDRKLL